MEKSKIRRMEAKMTDATQKRELLGIAALEQAGIRVSKAMMAPTTQELVALHSCVAKALGLQPHAPDAFV